MRRVTKAGEYLSRGKSIGTAGGRRAHPRYIRRPGDRVRGSAGPGRAQRGQAQPVDRGARPK